MADQTIDVVLNIVSKYTSDVSFAQLPKEQRELDINLQKVVQSLNAQEIAWTKYSSGQAKLASGIAHGKISHEQYNDRLIILQQTLLGKVIPALSSYNRILNDNDRILARQRVPGQLTAAAVTPAERLGAISFRATALPALKADLAEISRFNGALTTVENNLKNFDLIKARAFGRNYAPTIRREVSEIDRHNQALMRGQNIMRTIAQAATLFYFFRAISSNVTQAIKDILDFVTAANALSQILGITTEQASGFVYQANQIGVSVDTVTEAYRTFGDRLGRATGLFGEQNRGSRQMADAMKTLGIEMIGANGQVRSMGEIIPEVADAIQELGPGIKTTAIATALFGQRADEMLPLLLQGEAGMRRAAETANQLGFNLSKVETQQLREAQIALNDIQKSGEAVILTIAKGLAPVLPRIAEMAVGLAAAIDKVFVVAGTGAIALVGMFITAGAAFADLILILAGEQTGFEMTRRAIEATNNEIEAFKRNRGYDPNFNKLPSAPGPGTPYEITEQEQEAALEALQKLQERRLDIIQDFALDSAKIMRDYQIEVTRQEQDFDTGRLRDLEDFAGKMEQEGLDFYDKQSLRAYEFSVEQAQREQDFYAERSQRTNDFTKEQAQASRNFYAEQAQRTDDFTRKQTQASGDFFSDQLRREQDFYSGRAQAASDFAANQSQREQDFQQDQVDRQAGYETSRRRVIEDALLKSQEQFRQNADERIRIEEKVQETIARLREKWDDILLRLQVGGDRDSIQQANVRYEEELAKQQEANQLELAKFIEQQDLTGRIDQDDTALRLQRLDEDFGLEQDRRNRDFAIDQARREEEFLLKQSRSDEKFILDQSRREQEFVTNQSRQAEEFLLDQVRRDEEFRLDQSRRAEEFQLDRARSDEEFALKQASRAAEFATDQEARQSEFDQDQIRAINEFTIKWNREASDEALRRQRKKEDYDQEIRDRSNQFIRELNDINAQISAKSGLFNMEATNFGNHQAYLTELFRRGLAARRALALEYEDYDYRGGGTTRRALGGMVPGPLGMPVGIIAHGGEMISPPPTSNYYNSVRQGDQITINAPQSFTANMRRGDPHLIAMAAARELGRSVASLRSYRG